MTHSDGSPEVVFILGAGCSVEDNVPLINNFFDIAFEKVTPLLNSEQKIRFDIIKKFRKENLPDSNIEQLLSYIDLKRALFIDNKKYFNNLCLIREDLIYLIAKTIAKNIIRERSNNYQKFIRNHLNSSFKETIITFNWELLLDSIVFNRQINRLFDLYEADYGADFLVIDDEGKTHKVKRKSHYKLLKLHGSFNWMYCKKCPEKNRFFVFDEKSAIPILEGKNIQCPICKEPLNPLIVPPSFQKIEPGGGISLLNDIWVDANDAIIKADKIVIIGYSFPEDDVHFKHFFRSALVENYKKNKRPILIDVINYKPYLQQKSDFEKHYMRILEIPTIEIEPTFNYNKFSKFADNSS